MDIPSNPLEIANGVKSEIIIKIDPTMGIKAKMFTNLFLKIVLILSIIVSNKSL